MNLSCQNCIHIEFDNYCLDWDVSETSFYGDGICLCKSKNFLPTCCTEGILGELVVKYDFCCINHTYNKNWKQKRFNEICGNFQQQINWGQKEKRDKINKAKEGLKIVRSLLKENKLPKVEWGHLYNGGRIDEITKLLTEDEKNKHRELQVKFRLEQNEKK